MFGHPEGAQEFQHLTGQELGRKKILRSLRPKQASLYASKTKIGAPHPVPLLFLSVTTMSKTTAQILQEILDQFEHRVSQKVEDFLRSLRESLDKGGCEFGRTSKAELKHLRSELNCLKAELRQDLDKLSEKIDAIRNLLLRLALSALLAASATILGFLLSR